MSRVGVAVGCSYRSVDIRPMGGRGGRHQAVCSCGWEGPRRRHFEKAREDMEAHELDLIPAEATPGIVRTGQKVRITEEITKGESGMTFREGKFVGVGPDTADPSTQLLFVQIGSGLHAFPATTTTLQPVGEGG